MFKYEMTKQFHWIPNGGFHTEYIFEFDFPTREDYLEQRAGWRAEYKELSRQIRLYKTYRKPKNRPEDISSDKVLETLCELQEQARIMCQMRVQSKQQAYRQMMAKRAA